MRGNKPNTNTAPADTASAPILSAESVDYIFVSGFSRLCRSIFCFLCTVQLVITGNQHECRYFCKATGAISPKPRAARFAPTHRFFQRDNAIAPHNSRSSIRFRRRYGLPKLLHGCQPRACLPSRLAPRGRRDRRPTTAPQFRAANQTECALPR